MSTKTIFKHTHSVARMDTSELKHLYLISFQFCGAANGSIFSGWVCCHWRNKQQTSFEFNGCFYPGCESTARANKTRPLRVVTYVSWNWMTELSKFPCGILDGTIFDYFGLLRRLRRWKLDTAEILFHSFW